MIALPSTFFEDNNRPSTATVRELDVDVVDKNKDVEEGNSNGEPILTHWLTRSSYILQQTVIYELFLKLTFIRFRTVQAPFLRRLTPTMMRNQRHLVRSISVHILAISGSHYGQPRKKIRPIPRCGLQSPISMTRQCQLERCVLGSLVSSGQLSYQE